MDLMEESANPVSEPGDESKPSAPRTQADRQFGAIPEGYLEPVDVAFLNMWRRLLGTYPPSLGQTPLQRVWPYISGVLLVVGLVLLMHGVMWQESYDFFGRMGHHIERTPVLLVSDSEHEPPLRVEMALPRCDLCGNSVDVATQLAGSPVNEPKGRTDMAGARYVWNGPYTEEDSHRNTQPHDEASEEDAEPVGRGALYAYRWRNARLVKNSGVHNASVLLEVYDTLNDQQQRGADYEDRFFGDPLRVTMFGELSADSHEFTGLGSELYPLRRRARQRTVAEVQWQVPPNLHLMSIEDSVCDDAMCVSSVDIGPILRELAAQDGWSERSAVTIFMTMEGSGMRAFTMMHDLMHVRLNAYVGAPMFVGCVAGAFAIMQIDFAMGIFDVSDDLEQKIRKITIVALVPFSLFTMTFFIGGLTWLANPIPMLGWPLLTYNGALYIAVYLTTSYHTVARVQEMRQQIQAIDGGFFQKSLKAQCAAMNQLNQDLLNVTRGPVYKAILPWVVGFVALGFNNLYKLMAASHSQHNVIGSIQGFMVAVGILAAGLLVPARVTTECTRLVSDVNLRMMSVDSEAEMHALNALSAFITSLNDGAGIGFFLFGLRISEELVKSVVGTVATLALAYATSA